MPLQATIHAGLDRVTDYLYRAYAQAHPWFDVDADGNTVYATPLFDELDDILADIDADELAEELHESFSTAEDVQASSPQSGPSVGYVPSSLTLHESGTVVDRSQSMDGEWRDGPLAKAAQSGSVLLLDEVNRGPGR